MRHISYILFSYVGTHYHGFQYQPGLPTVEGCILSTMKNSSCFDEISKYTYSHGGRTDRGVSALGQIISLSLPEGCSLEKIAEVLNRECPGLKVWGIRQSLPPQFRIRYWALWREYVYFDVIEKYRSSVDSLREAAQKVISLETLRHFYKNFKIDSFPQKYFDRRLISIQIENRGKSLILRIRGESFIYHFVRRLVSFFRKYDESLTFEENLSKWEGGEAEAERLILSRVMTPYRHLSIYSAEEVASSLISSLSWASSLPSPQILREQLLFSWDP
ncbi:MAG: hypothetical protein QW039_06170 [Fervidicoccaceae archaeon]